MSIEGLPRTLIGPQSPPAILTGRDYLKKEKKGKLCENAPALLTLSILLDQVKDEINSHPKKFLAKLSSRNNLDDIEGPLVNADKSYMILRDLPIFEPYPNMKKQLGTAPSVLVKTFLGMPAGVILEGELTGVLLYLRKAGNSKYVADSNYPIESGMSINRFWNDELPQPIENYLSFYMRLFEYFTPRLTERLDFIGESSLRSAVTEMLKKRFKALVKKVRQTKKTKEVWFSEIFVEACKTAGIHVDEKSFLKTRA